MRILCLDVGTRTIGLAVSDALKITAQGVETYRRIELMKDIAKIANVVKEYEVSKIVVGLPKNMNGTIGPQGLEVQEFVKELKEHLNSIEIVMWDERLSTVAAEKSLIAADVSRSKRRKIIDKMAAVFILQGYLDSLPRH